MFRKKREREMIKELMRHDCMLPPEEPPIIRYISSGYFVYCRRALRNITLVSCTNPRSKLIFQSKASLRRETERHLKMHYGMIHPYSDAKIIWEAIMLYLVIFMLMFHPFHSYIHYDQKYMATKLGLDVVCLFDIIITFNSGYLNDKTNKVILKRSDVAKNYLKTWFIIDFLCTINFDLLLFYKRDEEMLTFVKLANFIKLLRIATLVRYLKSYREYRQITLYKFNFFKLILVTIILIKWATSFLYFMGNLFKEKWVVANSKMENIVASLYRVTYLFFLIGFGEEYSKSNYILLFEMLCWTGGVILRFFIMAEIVQIVSKYNAATNKYHQRIQRLRDFMKNKGLPAVTCKRILQYFDFRFQKSFYKEEQILSTLSTQLQQEIMLHTCKRLIENVALFKNLPTALVLRFVTYMKSVIYLPNDIIVQAGTSGESMYFIHNGTVAVYTSSGKEICHLTDGSNFGEIALILKDEVRVATVIAVDSCELYIMSRSDFLKAINPYPELHARMFKIAQDRMLDTKMTESELSRGPLGPRRSSKLKPYVQV